MRLDVTLDQHPFITRRLQDKLPLTDFEVHLKADNEFEIEGKFRKSINIFLVCALKGLNGK
jgi:hypothetical protein